MAQQVDFYILQGADETARLVFASRITGKAFQQGMQIYLQTENAAQVQQLNDLLWAFSPTSFLPHAIYEEGGKVAEPILLGECDPPENWNQLLISLTDQVPATAPRFTRVADLIGDDEQQKQVGRNRFRIYRDNGIEPKTHKMSV